MCMPFAHILQMLKFMHFFKLFRNVEFHTSFGAGKILETSPSLNPGYALGIDLSKRSCVKHFVSQF